MKVGIFWYYDGAVIGSAHALEHGNDAGEFIDSPVNHVTYWPLIQRQISCLRHTEYQEVPRGRALHDKTKSRAMIYMDKTLFTPVIKRRIRAFFALPARGTRFGRDAHYTTDENDLRALFE
jgi:hypothetical protein